MFKFLRKLLPFPWSEVRFAEPLVYLREATRMSQMVEKLNKVSGSEWGYFWSYTTNHKVESRGYYYLLWQEEPDTGRENHHFARGVAKASCNQMQRIIGEMVDEFEAKRRKEEGDASPNR